MGKLTRDGVALFYEDAGSGAPPLVFVHGLGSDHSFFTRQFEHFRRDHRVVAIDLRGHGLSDAPKKGYAVADLADDLAWMAYELGLYQPVFVGHGLGGMVAIECAARCPQLPARIVTIGAPLLPASEARRSATLLTNGPILPRRVAQLIQESVRAWDASVPLAGLRLPFLYVAVDTSLSDLTRLHTTCPQAMVEHLNGVGQLDAVIERFLAVTPAEQHAGVVPK